MNRLVRLAGPPLVAASLAFAACGGDDDAGGSAPSVALQGDGSDADYVKQICAAARTFNDEVQLIIKNATAPGQAQPDQSQTEKLVAEPTGKFAATLKAIKAPADAKAWNDATSAQFAVVAEAYKAGKPPPAPPAATRIEPTVAARLQKLAALNADCKVSGSPFAP